MAMNDPEQLMNWLLNIILEGIVYSATMFHKVPASKALGNFSDKDKRKWQKISNNCNFSHADSFFTIYLPDNGRREVWWVIVLEEKSVKYSRVPSNTREFRWKWQTTLKRRGVLQLVTPESTLHQKSNILQVEEKILKKYLTYQLDIGRAKEWEQDSNRVQTITATEFSIRPWNVP